MWCDASRRNTEKLIQPAVPLPWDRNSSQRINIFEDVDISLITCYRESNYIYMHRRRRIRSDDSAIRYAQHRT